jgi:hypothetical protein
MKSLAFTHKLDKQWRFVAWRNSAHVKLYRKSK